MLRLLMEQRSEDDLKLVMKWIEQQRNQQLREEVDKMLGTQFTRFTSTSTNAEAEGASRRGCSGSIGLGGGQTLLLRLRV